LTLFDRKDEESRSSGLSRLGVAFNDYLLEIAGVALLSLAVLTLLALFNVTGGRWLDPWVTLWRRWLGWGSVLAVAGFGLGGWRLLGTKKAQRGVSWNQVVAVELVALASLGLLSLLGGQSLEAAELGQFGGRVGWGLAEAFRLLFASFLPNWAALILSGGILFVFFLISLFWGLAQIRSTKDWFARPESFDGFEAMEASAFGAEEAIEADGQVSRKRARSTGPKLSKEFRKDFSYEAVEEKVLKPGERAAELPPLELLSLEKMARPNGRHINQTAGLLEKALFEFGIPAKVVGYKVGPTVTQFAVEPGYTNKGKGEEDEKGQKVRVSQISALQRDLALALSAQRLRIQAPVPGRSYVGIEVPNASASLVNLKPIIESEAFHKLKSPLSVALGRDVSGAPVVADLAKMPHLLVAGTTGSGKSVLISAITTCLVMNNSPEDLRLVMLDPKMVELIRFNELPHLVGKVETNLERITAVLRWVVAEMQRRYKLLEAVRVRDIENYNRKVKKNKKGEKLPRMVVLIDELADLMMTAAEHTESTLVRLAQMARATGIHLVVATQRPSTDVVTGLIKANFPARLSFAVASTVDSRVILDTSGAEALLGRGDMLYLSPEAGSPMRSQGVMINDKEVENVIRFWKDNWQDDNEVAVPWDEMIKNDEVLSDRDELVEAAIQEIKQTGKSSASHLQRALRIGYPRAARLVDQLEDMGVVGPVRGGGREREVLISIDDAP
jgi:S-DNA-T family DNA segregation ATPase FtsK/SpoIIIE